MTAPKSRPEDRSRASPTDSRRFSARNRRERPAESHLDTGNRRQFSDCGLSNDPSRATSEPCAGMVFAGERLRRIKRRPTELV